MTAARETSRSHGASVLADDAGPVGRRSSLAGGSRTVHSFDTVKGGDGRPRRDLTMATLDSTFPDLSGLVRRVLRVSLEDLASRAPASDFQFYDLERLLAKVRANEALHLDEICAAIFGAHHAQDRGYVATVDAFVKLGVIRDEKAFVEKK